LRAGRHVCGALARRSLAGCLHGRGERLGRCGRQASKPCALDLADSFRFLGTPFALSL